VEALSRQIGALFRAFWSALKYLVLFEWLRELVDLIRDLIGITRR